MCKWIDYKCICIKGCKYQLTAPYFIFNEGEVYDIKEYSDSYSSIYQFDYCDWIMTYESFNKYFMKLEDYRVMKINKILGL